MGLELVVDNNEVFSGKGCKGVLPRETDRLFGRALFGNCNFFTITYSQGPCTLIGYKDIPLRYSIADSTRRSDGEILPSYVAQFNHVSII